MRMLFAVSAVLLAGAAQAQALQPQRELERSYQICDSWSYNSEVNGYICSFTSYVDIPDDYDRYRLEQTISDLQYTVRDLEQRVRALEARP
jgi:hypothetical protein